MKGVGFDLIRADDIKDRVNSKIARIQSDIRELIDYPEKFNTNLEFSLTVLQAQLRAYNMVLYFISDLTKGI